MPSTPGSHSHPVRFALVSVIAVATALAVFASPAAAAEESTTVEIRASSDAVVVGEATFVRATDEGGADVLTVTMSVSGGIQESHVCVDDEPFTSKASAGHCLAQGDTGTSVTYTIPLDGSADSVFVQASVVTDLDGEESTAFAGWQPGQPFYGNVEVRAVGEETPVPAGAVGLAGLALVTAPALVALRWRKRRRL